jgi:hypothetical protein
MYHDARFTVDSSLPPDTFLETLAALGREWRQTAQPAVVRSVHAYAVKVRIRDRQFTVELVGTGSRTPPACVGRVVPVPSGSRIEARIGSSRSTQLSYVIGAIWFAFIAIMAKSLWAQALLLGGIVMAVGVALQGIGGGKERDALRILVTQIASQERMTAHATITNPLPNER